MSLWSRIANIVRGDRLSREIEEEFEAHIADAVAEGRDPEEARRALGPALRHREDSRDLQVVAWLDSLRADAVFSWRQLRKSKVTSLAAILSLGLAIGACTSAFRLIDALLLRPLPIAEPEQLYSFSRQGTNFDGKLRAYSGCAYPMFRLMRSAVKGEAELIAISYAERVDLTFGSDSEMEKAQLQFVSGWMFNSFGLQPERGRLFTENDDRIPHGHPHAVLSYDYWERRFGRDPGIIGRTFRMGNDVYEIVGVAGKGFTGTEPGTMIDVFLPTMMERSVERADSAWMRTLLLIPSGQNPERIRQKLDVVARNFESDRSKRFTDFSKERLARFLDQTALLTPAPSGVSGLQEANRNALTALAILVGLVLLIACANLANLMTAQAAARSREMALRVSIGAGRMRLVQLVLVECAWIAILSSAIGALFASWSAPFIVGMMNPPDNPVRLLLPLDLRVLAFGLALALGVTLLFGLAPALRASGVRPAVILKGGDDPHARRRLMHALIAVQVAFCFIVLFIGGLFIATFDRLSNQSTGFSSERLLTLRTVAAPPQTPVVWNQVAEHLRTIPGVETVAFGDRAHLDGSSWNGFVFITGAPPSEVLAFFRAISPGWFDAMRIPVLDGRDFRAPDKFPGPAIVNETFVKTYFNGINPVGRFFARGASGDRFQIVGVVGDVRYRNMRDPILPVAYFPYPAVNAKGEWQLRAETTFIVRTSDPNPLTMANRLRQEITRAHTGFRVSTLRTQQEIIDGHTVRERLLAILALFFAIVALFLAGVGLCGVLNYSVLQRRREIGIRMAIGATATDLARRVTGQVFVMVLVGAAMGLAAGLASRRYLESLLYQVQATGAGALATPSLALLAVAVLAALPAVIQAVRIDPVKTLRTE